jgi:hypothetical protein
MRLRNADGGEQARASKPSKKKRHRTVYGGVSEYETAHSTDSEGAQPCAEPAEQGTVRYFMFMILWDTYCTGFYRTVFMLFFRWYYMVM